MNELEKRYLESKAKLEKVNYILKTSGKLKGKNYFKRLKKQLVKQIFELENEIANNTLTFYIDKFALSVRSYTKRTKGKPRYLKIGKKVYNNMNACLLHNPKLNVSYVWLDTNSQLTRKDIRKALEIVKQIWSDAIIVTDKRHVHTLTFRKRYTQTIERLISRIKIPIYRKLAKAKSPKDVYDIYFERMRELGINIIP